MKYICRGLTLLFTVILVSVVPSYAQVSVTATAGTTGPSAYTSLRAAFIAVNNGTHRGVINISINANTTETATAVINASGGTANYTSVTIKPAAGTTPVISGNIASGALVKMNGSNNVTIDGSNTLNGTSTDLTLTNTHTTSPNVIVIGSVGTTPVNNVTVKNTIITNGSNSSTAFIVGDATAIGNPGYYSNITIQNNTIGRAYIGIYLYSVVSALVNNVTIEGNRLNASGVNAIRLVGIYVQGVRSIAISENTIGNFESASAEFDRAIWLATATRDAVISQNTITGMAYTGTSSYAPIGINVSPGVTNANVDVQENTISNLTSSGTGESMGIFAYSNASNVNIRGNKISNISNTNTTGYGASGMKLAVTNNSAVMNVYNNFIWAITAAGFNGYDAADNGNGIVIDGGGGYNIDHNSISLNSNPTLAGGHKAACLLITNGVTTAGVLNVRNNIFANLQTVGNGSSRFCIANLATQGSAVFSSINNNDYYSISGNLSSTGTDPSITTTIPQLQASLGGNGNSINVPPVFITINDLHLNPSGNAALENAGMPLPAYPADIDNEARSTTSPEIGADEIINCPALTINPSGAGIVYVDSSIAVSGDGSSWANAVKEPADALKAAKTNTAIQQIWVAKGTYKPLYDAASLCAGVTDRNRSFVLVNNVRLYGGFAGNETAITQRNWNTNLTILSGDIGIAGNNTDNVYHVVITNGPAGTAVLDGFTISGGNSNGSSTITVNALAVTADMGAGIYARQSSPAISNCIIMNNSAISTTGGGGGMFNISNQPVLTNCIFKGNTGRSAGASKNDNSNAVFINCLFTGNKAEERGGAMCNHLNSAVELINCTFDRNESDLDGGCFHNANSNPRVTNSIIWRSLSGVPAQNIFSNQASTPVVTYSIIQGAAVYPGIGNSNTNPVFIAPISGISVLPDSADGNYRLSPCSPAINAGNNAAIPAGITTDLNGNNRIQNITVDMGAYEAVPLVTVVPSPAGIVYVDSSIAISGDGSSWATAVKELADALRAAKTNTAIQQIWTAKGTYKPLYDAATGCLGADARNKSFVLVNNVKVYGGFAGNETLLTQRNWNSNITKLSGDIGTAGDNTDNAYHVAISAGAVGTAELNGFYVEDGNANSLSTTTVNGFPLTGFSGGGIRIQRSSPVIKHCYIQYNIAAQNGGGIYNTGRTIFDSVEINYNKALDATGLAHGGAVCTIDSSAVFNQVKMYGNSSGWDGGGFYSQNGNPILTNVIVDSNLALFGGGIYVRNSNSVMTNMIVRGNRGTAHGAAYIIGDVQLTNALISGNTATDAAGWGQVDGNSVLTNVTISGNRSTTQYGGYYIGSGTGILENCIIWGNTANGITNNVSAVAPGTVTIRNSTVQGAPVFAGPGNINTDPLFIAPQSSAAAPTTAGNYRLSPCGSPSADAGNNAAVPAGITTDLDNNTRIFNSIVDMGAYETQSTGKVYDTIAASICSGSFYLFNGQNLTATGAYNDTLTTVAGCDSILTLNLMVAAALTGIDVQTICTGQSYTFNGITYTTSNNTAQANFPTPAGCDSIVTLNLTVLPALTGTDVQTICQGQSYTFNGVPYTTSNNTAQATLNTSSGCDSVVTLNLTVLPALTGTDVQTICQGQSYTFNGITYTTSNNTAQATLTTSSGCDSIVTLNLTVLPALTGTDIQTICQGQSYTFNGIPYTTSNNTAQATLTTSSGCDSIVTLNLTVIPSSFSTNVQTICAGNSYTFNGIVYTTSNNTATDTLVNAAGCDSIITLNLTVRPQLTATNTRVLPTCSVASNGSITITPTNGTAPYSFSLNGGASQPSGTFNNLPVANYSIRITDANNCSNNFTVNLNAGPGITATAATTAACWQSANGSITITPSGGNTPYTYSLDGGIVQTNTGFTNVSPGNHTILVTDANGCTFMVNTTVAENPQITAALAVRNSCQNTNDGIITVNVNTGTAPFSYSINNGNSFQTSNVFSGLAANNYAIIVRDNLNCEASFTATVALQPAVPAFAGNDTTAVTGMPQQLFGNGGVSYLWSPAGLLNNATNRNPVAILQNDTRFILEVTDAIGCKGKDTVFIKVYNGPKYYIPNAFTPNNDGLNDVFRPTPVGMVSTEWFRIFNRYGEPVFSSSRFMEGWDGTFKGQLQPMGAYVWMIKGKDRNGKIVEEKGTVQLIR